MAFRSPGWSKSKGRRCSSRPAPMPDLVSEPAAGQTVSRKAQLAAAGLIHGSRCPSRLPEPVKGATFPSPLAR
jgi:hypothetical protein